MVVKGSNLKVGQLVKFDPKTNTGMLAINDDVLKLTFKVDGFDDVEGVVRLRCTIDYDNRYHTKKTGGWFQSRYFIIVSNTIPKVPAWL